MEVNDRVDDGVIEEVGDSDGVIDEVGDSVGVRVEVNENINVAVAVFEKSGGGGPGGGDCML